jgi:hypothetical protein
MKANLVAIPKVEFRGRTRSLEQSSGLPLNVPQERPSATSNNCFRRTTLSHKRLFETATNFVVLLLVVLISLPALAKAPERSVALIFQPARASDAEKVAQLRLLLAKTFRDRGMAIKRFLISFDNGGLERAKAKLKAARGALAKDTNLSHVPETETLLTTARYGFLSVLGEVSIDDLSATQCALALTRLAQDDRRLAAKYLDAALRINSGMNETRFRRTSDFFNLYLERKSSLASASHGHLKITSEPRGAEVYLGDELKGFTPMTVRNLSEGTHLIRIKRDGYYLHGWLADVKAEKTTKVHTKLRPMPGNSRHEKWAKILKSKRNWRKPEKIEEAVSGLRRLYKVTDVIVLDVSRGRKGYHLAGATDSMYHDPQPVKATVAADADLIASVRSLSLTLLPDKPKPPPPLPAPKKVEEAEKKDAVKDAVKDSAKDAVENSKKAAVKAAKEAAIKAAVKAAKKAAEPEVEAPEAEVPDAEPEVEVPDAEPEVEVPEVEPEVESEVETPDEWPEEEELDAEESDKKGPPRAKKDAKDGKKSGE